MEQVEVECRCKDCIYFEKDIFGIGDCYYWGDESGTSYHEAKEEDFCSNGVNNENP